MSTPQDRAPGTADELTLTDRDVAACWHDAVDLGEVRYRHRDWPPSWWAWLVWLVLPAVVFLVPQPWWSNLAVYLVLVGFLGAFVLNGWSHQVLVRERAVVLTSSLGRRCHVLPLWAMDPTRPRVHERYPLMGRRTGSVSRLFHTALYSTTAVTLEGLDPELARSEDPARFHLVRRADPAPWQRFLRVGPGWPHFGDQVDLPLATWVVSTHRPRELLAAVEQALVDSGRASARGLAERALASPVVEQYRTPLTDEQIYGSAGGGAPWFHEASEPAPWSWGRK